MGDGTSKHQPGELEQMQSLPLDIKIKMTKRRIKEWYEHWDGMVYVSFSGGKDSTVLKHIVDSMYDDIPSVFINTGLEYPEIQRFAMSQKNIVTVRPEMRFVEVLKKYGYPVISKEVALKITETKRCPNGYASQSFDSNSPKIQKYGSRYDLTQWKYLFEAPFNVSHRCCDVMKKKPSKMYEKQTGRKAIIGTLAAESRARQTVWEKYGCNAFEKKGRPTSQPLSFWTEQDILHYIKKYNVPYCSVYGEIVVHDEDGYPCYVSEDYIEVFPDTKLYTTGCDRTGCVFCTFGCHRESSPNRFQRLKETHPRQYEYCIGGGEYITEGYAMVSSGEWKSFVFEHDDGTPFAQEEVEEFINEHKNDPRFRFERKWKPSKEGLGLWKVLDYIGVKY